MWYLIWDLSQHSSVCRAFICSTSCPSFEPQQWLVTGTWKRSAQLLCWQQRGNQVSHQRSISGMCYKCTSAIGHWVWNPESKTGKLLVPQKGLMILTLTLFKNNNYSDLPWLSCRASFCWLSLTCKSLLFSSLQHQYGGLVSDDC